MTRQARRIRSGKRIKKLTQLLTQHFCGSYLIDIMDEFRFFCINIIYRGKKYLPLYYRNHFPEVFLNKTKELAYTNFLCQHLCQFVCQQENGK